jgi:hypothetical protein
VCGRILPSVKFKRKSTKLLSLSELTNLRKSSEAEVSKGKVPLFGRRMDEICLEEAMVCCDHWIWERVWELTLGVIRTSRVRRTEKVCRKGGKIHEVLKLTLSLRYEDARECPDRQI